MMDTPEDAGAVLHSGMVNGICMEWADTATTAEERRLPAVLFLHGWPESWYSWRFQLAAVKDAGYRGVAPSMRGYGATESPGDYASYNCYTLAADALALLQRLGIAKAALVGHDHGANLGWKLSLLHPQVICRALRKPVHRQQALLRYAHAAARLAGLHALRCDECSLRRPAQGPAAHRPARQVWPRGGPRRALQLPAPPLPTVRGGAGAPCTPRTLRTLHPARPTLHGCTQYTFCTRCAGGNPPRHHTATHAATSLATAPAAPAARSAPAAPPARTLHSTRTHPTHPTQ